MIDRRRTLGGMARFIPAVSLLAVMCSTVWAAPVSQEIKMDYFGYRPNDTKIAIFTTDPGATVQVRTTGDSVVYTVPTDGGSLASMGFDDQPTGDNVWQVDFSGFTTEGSYRLYVPAWDEQSYDFDLADDVYNDAGRVALKTYYYQRCGVPHPGPYADEGYRDPYVCHSYLTECTAASGEPDYGTLDLSGGWHDAGDYNKYVWGDLFLATDWLLIAYESNPIAWCDAQLGIPESGNGVPDILDEVKVAIDWLLKMQMPGGEVLSRVWDDYAGAGDSCPPSNAVHPHYYYGPNVEAAGIFTGSVAKFARICEAEGDPYGNVAALKAAALHCWNDYLVGLGDGSDPWWSMKLWAAAELWRMDQSVTSARDFVEGQFANWADAFMEGYNTAFHAAVTYIQTPGADPAVVSGMKTAIGVTVDDYFNYRGPYRNSMRDPYYHWGSNKCRGSWGGLLVQAANLGATGSHTAEECLEFAQDYLHAFHGQNPMRMVYLTNMAAYGGEHSSFQMYHSWFGIWGDPESNAWYIGLPPGVTEPDFPYFKGVDNYGISDDNYSDYGPLPGLVVGGPNKDYSGRAKPPTRETYYERVYRDWTSDAPDGWYRTKVWEVTENSISYQAPYIALAAAFMGEGVPQQIDTDPPAAPTGLTATAVSASQIDLDWNDNNEQDLYSYCVYRSLTPGGPYEMVAADVTQSAYSDVGLEDDTTYYYVVTAVDTSGNESDESNEASATTESSAGTMHVGGISHGGQNGPASRRGRWVDITIVDSTDAPVQGATVFATAEGWDDYTQSNVIETFSGDTGSDGKVRFITIVDAGSMCVDDVTHATLTYDAGQNEVTCAYW
jgi:endoglucanase